MRSPESSLKVTHLVYESDRQFKSAVTHSTIGTTMTRKLLIADDSLTIQKVIKLALSNDGYEIHSVSDGVDLLQQMMLFRPDVVLLDIAIPGKSAFELKQLLNNDPELNRIPIILMCSAFEKMDEAKIALLHFQGRLTKPFDPTHLRTALNQALDEVIDEVIDESLDGLPQLGIGNSIPSKSPELTQEMVYPPPIFGKLKEESQSAPVPSVNHDEDKTGDIPLLSRDTDDLDDVKILVESTLNPSPLQTLEINEDDSELDESIELTSNLAPPPNFQNFSKLKDTQDIPAFEGWGIEEPLKKSEDPFPPLEKTPQREQKSHSKQPQRLSTPTTALGGFETPEFDKAELDALVAKKVEERIADLARRAIPDIAEKVIKSEIRKLLESLK